MSMNGTPVAGARSCELNVNCEAIGISTPLSGRWREYISGMMEWTASCNTFVLRDAITLPTPLITNVGMVGQTVTLRLEVVAPNSLSTGDVIEGTAIVKTWRATGSVPNLAEGAFSFMGSGELGPVSE